MARLVAGRFQHVVERHDVGKLETLLAWAGDGQPAGALAASDIPMVRLYLHVSLRRAALRMR